VPRPFFARFLTELQLLVDKADSGANYDRRSGTRGFGGVLPASLHARDAPGSGPVTHPRANVTRRRAVHRATLGCVSRRVFGTNRRVFSRFLHLLAVSSLIYTKYLNDNAETYLST
jgi:hypothetical protein